MTLKYSIFVDSQQFLISQQCFKLSMELFKSLVNQQSSLQALPNEYETCALKRRNNSKVKTTSKRHRLKI